MKREVIFDHERMTVQLHNRYPMEYIETILGGPQFTGKLSANGEVCIIVPIGNMKHVGVWYNEIAHYRAPDITKEHVEEFFDVCNVESSKSVHVECIVMWTLSLILFPFVWILCCIIRKRNRATMLSEFHKLNDRGILGASETLETLKMYLIDVQRLYSSIGHPNVFKVYGLCGIKNATHPHWIDKVCAIDFKAMSQPTVNQDPDLKE